MSDIAEFFKHLGGIIEKNGGQIPKRLNDIVIEESGKNLTKVPLPQKRKNSVVVAKNELKHKAAQIVRDVFK